MANPNPNTKGLKPFKKGDPRINRYGRPKSFDVLRKLALRIASEPAAIKDGYTVTKIEAMLNNMMASRNAAHNKTFLEYAFGKVPETNNNLNIDMSKLTIEQLERIAKGEDVIAVLADTSAG